MLINLLGLIICTDCIEYVGQEARRDGQYSLFLKGVNHKGFQRYLWISEDQKDILAKMFDIEIKFKKFDKNNQPHDMQMIMEEPNYQKIKNAVQSEVNIKLSKEQFEKENKKQTFLDLGIEELNLTQRTYNILSDRGCKIVKDVMKYSSADLLDIQGFGVRSLREIKCILEKGGLYLKD